MRPDPIACCTSAASPYAAGAASAIIRKAREILGDMTPGIKNGIVASGCTHPKKGPLKDGVFELGELKDVLFRTAEVHPAEGRDDGDVHWAGDPRAPDHTDFGLGANPFCAGCTTMPVAWSDIPENGASYQLIGYGGVNERSSKLAAKVLAGRAALPDRAEADMQYQQDQEIRTTLYEGPPPREREVGAYRTPCTAVVADTITVGG